MFELIISSLIFNNSKIKSPSYSVIVWKTVNLSYVGYFVDWNTLWCERWCNRTYV